MAIIDQHQTDGAAAGLDPGGDSRGDAPVPSGPDGPAVGSSKPSSVSFESLAVAGFVLGVFAIVVAAFAVGLAARAASEGSGGGAAAGPAPNAIDMTMTEFAFDPDEASIAVGGTITVTNEGTIEHDLVLDSHRSEMIEPGATAELVVSGIEPGEYQYWCSVPGHRDAGMEGTVTVR